MTALRIVHESDRFYMAILRLRAAGFDVRRASASRHLIDGRRVSSAELIKLSCLARDVRRRAADGA